MRDYQGDRKGDKLIATHRYVQEHGAGFESLNFYPTEGVCYGFMPLWRNGEHLRLNLKNLGAQPNDYSVEDVFVVWTARHPDGRSLIVGWYDHATAYAEARNRPSFPSDLVSTPEIRYWIEAPVEHCHVISEDERSFEIPRLKRGYPGQSAVWYGESNPGF
jgi:hypothetical protein